MSQSKYSLSTDWADVVPIPQDDPPNALASIAYPDDYSEAMSYLRAVMAMDEVSERVLGLTEDIIDINPAHYTVWLYRARVILALGDADVDKGVARLRREIEWLNPTALKHQKNYQIWQHRQVIVERLDSAAGEVDFITEMFAKDAKNYHVWSYRQWLVKRFDLWDSGELQSVEKMLNEDVRNNSAWNHRWFVVFGRPDGSARFGDRTVVDRELKFAQDAIRQAPQNQSPWNYLAGISRRVNGQAATLVGPLVAFASEFAPVDQPEHVRSSHALDFLASAPMIDSADAKKRAVKALELLSKTYDPIRSAYWDWRKDELLRREVSVGKDP